MTMPSGWNAIDPNQSYADTRDSFSSGISWCIAVIQETPKTSMAMPLTNITALSPDTGSGTASAADGRASGKTQSVPASNSRRGFQRIMSIAPHSVPAPNAARASP